MWACEIPPSSRTQPQSSTTGKYSALLSCGGRGHTAVLAVHHCILPVDSGRPTTRHNSPQLATNIVASCGRVVASCGCIVEILPQNVTLAVADYCGPTTRDNMVHNSRQFAHNSPHYTHNFPQFPHNTPQN
jgi:hypothetical protein